MTLTARELTSMYLSSDEVFVIWLVIALITGCIYIKRRGGDDDHDQGAGAAGFPVLCF